MKYAIVGVGSRHAMFRDAVAETYAKSHRLVGLCDANPARLALSAGAVRSLTGTEVPTYAAEQFEEMVATERPDCVIVTTPDHLHDQYIVAALELGCDVITEKPMTIDLPRLGRILNAQARTGRKVTVSFNYRYSPARTQLKELLMDGTIGEITAVDFRWYLDRVHGADYFRRWHRYTDRSGGLLVHKSTHHFDLLNWWIGSTPVRVSGIGKRAFYRPETAVALGLGDHGERCHGCPVRRDCDFELDLAGDAKLKELFLDSESHDGYFRDACVFADDITIDDTMQVQVEYRSGTSLNYTLVAYSPWEGLEVKFHGTKGELTHRHIEVHGVFGGGRREHAGDDAFTTELHLAGGLPQQLEVWAGTGTHGGADPIMLGYLFDAANVAPDKYARSSDHLAGAWSILTGLAANRAIAMKQTVVVEDLLARHGIALG